jgi:hypothetical protein
MDQESPDDDSVPETEHPTQQDQGGHAARETGFTRTTEEGEQHELDDQVEIGSKTQPTLRTLISHRTAIAGGAVGIIGALIGGAITGVSSYLTMTRQLDSQAHQSLMQFYLSQRQQAYVKMLDDSINIVQPISAYAAQFAVRDPGSADFLNIKNDTYQLISTLKGDYNAIRLIGGPDVISAAHDLWMKSHARVNDIDNLYLKWVAGSLPESDRRSSYTPHSEGVKAEAAAQDKFADVARADLESTR